MVLFWEQLCARWPSMLSGLDSALKGSVIDRDFTQLIPLGNAQTGHKHGHHDVSYVEYMTLGKEKSVVTGADVLLLRPHEI